MFMNSLAIKLHIFYDTIIKFQEIEIRSNGIMKNKKSKQERMLKMRRVMAMIGVIIIALLYIYFFFLAFRNDPGTMPALFAAFAATIIVPVIMYALGLLAKNMADYSDSGSSSGESESDVSDSGKTDN